MARNDNRQRRRSNFELFLESRYLNIKQVADILGVPKSFIYRRIGRAPNVPGWEGLPSDHRSGRA